MRQGGSFTSWAPPPVSKRCVTRLVRPRSASSREMAFPHFHRPSYSARGTCPILRSIVAGPYVRSHIPRLSDNRAADAGCPEQDGSSSILTFESSVMIIS
ncbi:hypothetical protein T07_13166 [Trichinella nelsoni]|uniref:Uncharacterized protein n=1 Tax=Trichinella nelsoni TaxID=6336 RepID=A0A0V0S033_9BILA|nr:hypothetical protein T07_13166 [Trichinella nelsoni]